MKYRVNAKITISISTIVEANNEEEAIKLAEDKNYQDIPSNSYYDEEDFWVAGGELDGVAFDLEVDKIEQ